MKVASTDVENLLRHDHIRPEELLTDGPNNRLNLQIRTEETTVGNTKGKKKGVLTKKIRIRRKMFITKHEDVLRMFLPIIGFCASILLLFQSGIAVAVMFY